MPVPLIHRSHFEKAFFFTPYPQNRWYFPKSKVFEKETVHAMSDDNTKHTAKGTVTTPSRQVEFTDWPCQEAAHSLWPSGMRSPPQPQCVWLLLSAACTVSAVGGVNIGVNFKLEGNNSGIVYTTWGGRGVEAEETILGSRECGTRSWHHWVEIPLCYGVTWQAGGTCPHAAAPGLPNEMPSSLVTLVASCTIVVAAIMSI